jgi:iron complex outermembrane receptor protein
METGSSTTKRRLRSAAGRAFRIPTFTELYYQDSSNEGNPALRPESAWSEEPGADFIPAKEWLGSLTLFSRQEQNVIDWIRQSVAEKWHSANIRSLRADGVEIGLERSLRSQARLELHYSRLRIDAGTVNYLSKYVLDYARDSATASASVRLPFGFAYRQALNYKRRSDGQSYWLVDGSLEHRFGRLRAAIDFTNLLNARYQDITGVDMPGRWLMATLSAP